MSRTARISSPLNTASSSTHDRARGVGDEQRRFVVHAVRLHEGCRVVAVSSVKISACTKTNRSVYSVLSSTSASRAGEHVPVWQCDGVPTSSAHRLARLQRLRQRHLVKGQGSGSRVQIGVDAPTVVDRGRVERRERVARLADRHPLGLQDLQGGTVDVAAEDLERVDARLGDLGLEDPVWHGPGRHDATDALDVGDHDVPGLRVQDAAGIVGRTDGQDALGVRERHRQPERSRDQPGGEPALDHREGLGQFSSTSSSPSTTVSTASSVVSSASPPPSPPHATRNRAAGAPRPAVGDESRRRDQGFHGRNGTGRPPSGSRGPWSRML